MTSARRDGRRRVRPESVVGWAAAAVVVLVVYIVVVLGGGALVGRTETPHMGLSVLATALVAWVVEPVRGRAERGVARRMHSAQRSPYEVLAECSRELARADAGQQEQAPAVIARLLALGAGVEWAQVWVLLGERLHLVAQYPAGPPADVPPPRLYETEKHEGMRAVTVAHGRRPLGVLRVKEHPSRPMTPVDDRLLGGLAAQAGMVLETAQLREELSLRLEELTAREEELRRARVELVTTQDRERRRLERDIHDGAQQQLVALAINLKLARVLAGTEPARAGQVLREQLDATSVAIRTLSDLSSGLLPETLARLGLAAAVAEATVGNPVPVHVEATATLPRFPAAMEATLYFCAIEAVQNATKHADAARIVVRIRESVARLELVIEDDGRGLGAGTPEGSGLANMRERVASLGGDLALSAGPAGGTAVTVTVPVPSPAPAAVG